MSRHLLPLALILMLGACAAGSGPSDVLPGEASATGRAKTAIHVVGTPVHAVLKGATCVATGVVGIPVASAAAIARDDQLRRDTYGTVGRTCGGSYVLGDQ